MVESIIPSWYIVQTNLVIASVRGLVGSMSTSS